MGQAISKNVAKNITNVQTSVENSTNVTNEQASFVNNYTELDNCNIYGNVAISNDSHTVAKNTQVAKVTNTTQINNTIQQNLQQTAKAMMGSLGFGTADANNLGTNTTNSTSNIKNTVNLISSQYSFQTSGVFCENSNIGGTLSVNNLADSNFSSSQQLHQKSVSTIVNNITQSIKQKSSATVQGAAALLIALAILIAALGYGIEEPLNSKGGKIIICVILVIALGALCLWLYTIWGSVSAPVVSTFGPSGLCQGPAKTDNGKSTAPGPGPGPSPAAAGKKGLSKKSQVVNNAPMIYSTSLDGVAPNLIDLSVANVASGLYDNAPSKGANQGLIPNQNAVSQMLSYQINRGYNAGTFLQLGLGGRGLVNASLNEIGTPLLDQQLNNDTTGPIWWSAQDTTNVSFLRDPSKAYSYLWFDPLNIVGYYNRDQPRLKPHIATPTTTLNPSDFLAKSSSPFYNIDDKNQMTIYYDRWLKVGDGKSDRSLLSPVPNVLWIPTVGDVWQDDSQCTGCATGSCPNPSGGKEFYCGWEKMRHEILPFICSFSSLDSECRDWSTSPGNNIDWMTIYNKIKNGHFIIPPDLALIGLPTQSSGPLKSNCSQNASSVGSNFPSNCGTKGTTNDYIDGKALKDTGIDSGFQDEKIVGDLSLAGFLVIRYFYSLLNAQFGDCWDLTSDALESGGTFGGGTSCTLTDITCVLTDHKKAGGGYRPTSCVKQIGTNIEGWSKSNGTIGLFFPNLGDDLTKDFSIFNSILALTVTDPGLPPNQAQGVVAHILSDNLWWKDNTAKKSHATFVLNRIADLIGAESGSNDGTWMTNIYTNPTDEVLFNFPQDPDATTTGSQYIPTGSQNGSPGAAQGGSGAASFVSDPMFVSELMNTGSYRSIQSPVIRQIGNYPETSKYKSSNYNPKRYTLNFIPASTTITEKTGGTLWGSMGSCDDKKWKKAGTVAKGGGGLILALFAVVLGVVIFKPKKKTGGKGGMVSKVEKVL